MADLLGERMPETLADVNHAGAVNSSTTDSWTEGFAEFLSMNVGNEIAGREYPYLYRVNQYTLNLESNYALLRDGSNKSCRWQGCCGT